MEISRSKTSHKGENGRVLIIAGSKDYPGAAFLTASALCTLRLGTDLVTVACPEKVAWAINSLNPDIITHKLKGDYISKEHLPDIEELIKKNDIILIGPGISKKSKGIVKEILKIDKPKVIDADALKTINLKTIDNYILTPHQHEFETLLQRSKLTEDNYKEQLKDNIILLKGNMDLIITKEKTYINRTGNSGMSVGGTGDILAGLVTGFLSQGESPLDSCKKAAKLNGIIGDKIKNIYCNGFIASDFLSIIAMEAKKL